MANFSDLAVISNSSGFQNRVLYALNVAAVNVMSETSVVPYHSARSDFATKIIGNSFSSQPYALAVLTNATISNEATITATADNGIPDGDIQFSVNGLFNAFAGVRS